MLRISRGWPAWATTVVVATLSAQDALAQVSDAPAPEDAAQDTATAEPALTSEDEFALDADLEVEPELAEVVVKATPTEARRLQQSAEAVQIVDTRKTREQTVDLGEMLARTQGVGVRRSGGLGSDAAISLNGLQGDQVRFFLDGVPLQLAGYPFGLVNIPANLVERLEIYRGVVPIRFGADALGGAINVVTDQSEETHAAASYQVGSFGTVRATANGRYRHEPTGILLGATGFLDTARNDYWMDDRPLPTPDGGTVFRSVRRFHDAYLAYGGGIEVGVLDQTWARRLLVQVFFAGFEKELQHNSVMSVPYGEITHGETMYGASARYAGALADDLELELLANLAHRRIDFRDMATNVYRWTGEPGRAVGREGARGELRGEAIDQSVYEDSFYGRAGLSWQLSRTQALRASLTPQLSLRTGDDHVPDRVDLLGLKDDLFQVVGGVEHELSAADERLSNILFAKAYYLQVSHEQRSLGVANPRVLELEQNIVNWGAGDALRYQFNDWLLAKVSYEYATRLPRPDELFGNGVLIESNASLKPEQSHNLNLGPRLELSGTPYGSVLVDINAFLRESQDQIILLGGRSSIPYANLADMRGLGIESAVSWATPSRWVSLDGTFTWQDMRNTSTDGPFEPMHGMRIPSRPYLFASWGVRFRITSGPAAFEPYYYGRYTHGFDRGWAIGAPEFKISLPAQVTHDAGITYSLLSRYGRLSCTFEVDNLTDAALYDNFGVQLPGRAFNLELNVQL